MRTLLYLLIGKLLLIQLNFCLATLSPSYSAQQVVLTELEVVTCLNVSCWGDSCVNQVVNGIDARSAFVEVHTFKPVSNIRLTVASIALYIECLDKIEQFRVLRGCWSPLPI